MSRRENCFDNAPRRTLIGLGHRGTSSSPVLAPTSICGKQRLALARHLRHAPSLRARRLSERRAPSAVHTWQVTRFASDKRLR